MAQYRKKPVVVEAVRWWGKYSDGTEWPEWFREAFESGVIWRSDTSLMVKTTEGLMRGESGDWVIRGVIGELYPCKPDVFEKTYEEVPCSVAEAS